MTRHSVVIAGGGPTGLMLAGGLAVARGPVVFVPRRARPETGGPPARGPPSRPLEGLVERRASQELDGRRAGGLHSRTIEVLDQRGIADRFLAEGQPHPGVGFAYIPLDISDLPTRHPYLLSLWQRDFERILAGWVEGLR